MDSRCRRASSLRAWRFGPPGSAGWTLTGGASEPETVAVALPEGAAAPDGLDAGWPAVRAGPGPMGRFRFFFAILARSVDLPPAPVSIIPSARPDTCTI